MLAKLRAADSRPGVLDVIGDAEYFLFGGHEERGLRGDPGAIVARREGAICRATIDGAVWIPQMRGRPASGGPATFKVPATLALGGSVAGVPEVTAPPAAFPGLRTYREISYREAGGVGYLEFSFPGGAMSTSQCRRLLAAYRYAQGRPVRVIVLGGPRDIFSNGIHLNVIEACDDPAEEAWRNINAINDLVHAILTTTDRLTVAALAGNAAAGGLMLALAADEVWCRAGAVLNPHYRLMGLHGSEYWTYTLPRRVGAEQAARLTEACLPAGPASALRSGLIDRVIEGGTAGFRGHVADLARQRNEPGLPAAAGREEPGTDRRPEDPAAGRLPRGRTSRDAPELLRPPRAPRGAAPRLCPQAQAVAHSGPPAPPPAHPGPSRSALVPWPANDRRTEPPQPGVNHAKRVRPEYTGNRQ